MLALLIIALLIGIAALAVAVIDFLKFKKYDAIINGIESLNNRVKGVELRVDDLENDDGHIVYPSLGGAVYDERTSTMTVFGNIKAEGWISCETIKEE